MQVLFLKYVLGQLYIDLRVRLHVFNKTLSMKGEVMKSRRETLLSESLLWRLFSVRPGIGRPFLGRPGSLPGVGRT